MKTIGIICELNPLHNGHKYLIDMARQKFGADYVLLVMSGDYTQRGTPSIVSKETRTKMALMAGADAVFELPVQYATGSAEYFASGAVSLLNSLGIVDHILFGTENGDIKEINEIASILNDEPEEYQKALQDNLKKGLNFASARDDALKKITSLKNNSTLIGSNNILGIEYCRALMASNSKITPLTIKREGADYNEEKLSETFSSAAAIRNVLENSIGTKQTLVKKCNASKVMNDSVSEDNSISNHDSNSNYESASDTADLKTQLKGSIPEDILDILLSEKSYNCLDNYSDYLHYKLLTERDHGFTSYADIHRDLSDKIINHLPEYTTISEFITLLKSKDLTYTRIQRCMLHILLGIKHETLDALKNENYPVYLRLLGFKKESSKLLADIREHADSPVISRMSDSFKIEDQRQKELLSEDILASDIYHLIIPQTKNEYQKPVTIL